MFCNGFITKSVRDAPNYNAMICEFEVGFEMNSTISDLSQHCHLFVKSICDGSKGGSAYLAAQSLANEWNKVLSKHELELPQPVLQDEPLPISLSVKTLQTKIQFDTEDQVQIGLQSLHDEYQLLLPCLKRCFEDNFRVENVVKHANQFIAKKDKIYEIATFEGVFDCNNFFDCELLQYLVHRFLFGYPVYTQMKEYVLKLENFKKSSVLEFIRNALEKSFILNTKLSIETSTLVFKLDQKWLKQSADTFSALSQYLFSKRAHILQLTKLEEGSVIAQFLVPKSQTHLVLEHLAEKNYFMCRVGVLEIAILEEKVIFSQMKDDAFTFENSLLEEVQIAKTYNETFQFLLELADIDYQNEDGKTPIMLASDCGHEQIVQGLIFSGANLDKHYVSLPKKTILP